MEEQNIQGFENQELESKKIADANNVKTKKHLSLKSKISVIVGTTFLAVAITIAILFVSGAFKHKHDINFMWTYETIKKRTCYEDGIRVKSCDICGESETQYIQAGHSNKIWVAQVEGDCFTDRIENLVCPDCNLIYETRTIPASHDNSDNGFCLKCNQWIINIVLPDTPITVHDFTSSSNINKTLKITNMQIQYIKRNYENNYNIRISWGGEKTYDDDGNNYSTSVGFGYKLFDSDGYVIKTGTVYTSVSVCVGEKFKKEYIDFTYINLYPNQTYILEILNTK